MNKLRIGEGIPANHAARAVDITAVFPPVRAGESARHKAAAVAGARGRSAEPMNAKGTTLRSAAYHRQNGTVWLTPAQVRRMEKKYRAGLGHV